MSSRRLLVAVAILALASVAEADLDDAKVKMDDAFAPGATAEARLQAVFQASLFDEPDAAALLIFAVSRTQALLDPLIEEKAEVDEWLEEILGHQLSEPFRDYPKGVTDRDVRAKKREAVRLRAAIDGENQVLDAIETGLSRMRNPEVATWLGEKALRREKHWKGRQVAAAALIAIGTPEAGRLLLTGLRDKDDRVRLAVAVGLGKLKVAEALDDLIGLLRDRTWTVRSAAIQALGDIGEKGAVGPLIDQLEKETGRLAEDCAQALSKLTGQRFGQVPEAWRKWWEENKEKYGGEGGEPLGGHPPDETGDPGPGYYGLPILTNRAIFILDISGSMAEPAPGGRGTGARPEDFSKLERAKKELIRVIDAFDPNGTIGLLVFCDAVRRFKDHMVPATRANKEAAKAFVRDLEPASSTNIYDALESAFRMVGMGAGDKHYDLAADTIFLLSDGAPTKPTGELDDWMKIIRACRQWNRLKRVKIMTIGIGNHDRAFMSKLAAENGGRYVAR